jgi:hypothetical protein
MSLSKMDLKIPGGSSRSTFAIAMAKALRDGYGQHTSAIKTVARLTGSHKRAVKNWFAAKNGPRGDHLILLLRESDHVLAAVLALSGRPEVLGALQVAAGRELLRDMLRQLDELTGRQTTATPPF